MFYLYGTGVLTACFAVATRESRCIIWINWIQKVTRTIHVLCSVLIVFFHLHHILETSSFKFLNVCRILYNLIITYMILFTETGVSCKLDEHINALLTNIQAKGKKQIKFADLSLTLIDTTICILQFTLFILYAKDHGVKTGYIILMGKGSSPNYPIYYLGLVNFFYLICSVVGASHYYILVQFINYIYAKQVYSEMIFNSPYIKCHCHRTYSACDEERAACCTPAGYNLGKNNSNNQLITKFHPCRAMSTMNQLHMQTLIRLELIFLNKLRRQINESIGINAFGLMVPLWSFLVIGASNVLVNGQLFSTYFTILTILVPNCYIWAYAGILVATSNKSTDVINSIRNLGKSLLLYMDSYGCMDWQLKEYLLLEPVEPLKMWEFIEIRSCLLLRVMNSIIPITAMLITSMQSYVS